MGNCTENFIEDLFRRRSAQVATIFMVAFGYMEFLIGARSANGQSLQYHII